MLAGKIKAETRPILAQKMWMTTVIVASGRDVSDDIRPEWSFVPKPYRLDRILEVLGDSWDSTPDAGLAAAM